MTEPVKKPAPRKPATRKAPAKKPTPARTPRKTGQPSKLNPERLARVLNAVALGIPITAATSTSGVPYPTWKRWHREGEQEVERTRIRRPDIEVDLIEWAETHGLADTYTTTAKFWTTIPRWAPDRDRWLYLILPILTQHARDRAEASALRTIRAAAKDDWKAAAWFLERTRSSQYGRTDRHQVEGVPGGAPITLAAVPAPQEVADRVKQLVEERRALAAAASDEDEP